MCILRKLLAAAPGAHGSSPRIKNIRSAPRKRLIFLETGNFFDTPTGQLGLVCDAGLRTVPRLHPALRHHCGNGWLRLLSFDPFAPARPLTPPDGAAGRFSRSGPMTSTKSTSLVGAIGPGSATSGKLRSEALR
jgi:hypothetical protein